MGRRRGREPKTQRICEVKMDTAGTPLLSRAGVSVARSFSFVQAV